MELIPGYNFYKTKLIKINKIRKFSILVYLLLFMFSVSSINAQEDTNTVKELLVLAKDKAKLFTEVIKICDDAISVSEKIKYQQGKADALNIKGKAYLKLGEYAEAMKAFFEELSLIEKNPDRVNSSIGNVYNMIGESYRTVANYNLAIEYLNKALKINLEREDEKETSHTYNRLAAVYYEMSFRWCDTSANYISEEYAKKSLEISEKLKDNDLIISSYNIIGADYSCRKDFDNALKYFLLALDGADKDTTYADRPNILNNISSMYYEKKEYEKSIEYGFQSYELSKKSGIKVYILVACRILSESYVKTGDFQNAFKYLVEAYNLYVKIYDERKTAEIYGIQKKHENEIMEKEERANITKRIILSIAMVVLLVILGLGAYSRHKQQVLLNRELEQKNKLINIQKEELARSNTAKDKFFSILSHDIRNPLNGILGFSNVLDSEFENISDDEKKEYISYLRASSESLFKLIDRLLIWSRLQSGRIEIVKENINLCEIITNVMGLQNANAIRKGIMLENLVPNEINVFTDKNILDMISRNLLDNAVKFTEAGGKITIKSEIVNNNVLVSIIDTGVGICKADLDKIFQIDQKISSRGTDSEEGTGLGLVLCKEMLELLGTTLKVESEKGKGSRFFFELPLS